MSNAAGGISISTRSSHGPIKKTAGGPKYAGARTSGAKRSMTSLQVGG